MSHKLEKTPNFVNVGDLFRQVEQRAEQRTPEQIENGEKLERRRKLKDIGRVFDKNMVPNKFN